MFKPQSPINRIFCIYCKSILKIRYEIQQSYHTSCHIEIKAYKPHLDTPRAKFIDRYPKHTLFEHDIILEARGSIGFISYMQLLFLDGETEIEYTAYVIKSQLHHNIVYISKYGYRLDFLNEALLLAKHKPIISDFYHPITIQGMHIPKQATHGILFITWEDDYLFIAADMLQPH